MRVFGAEYCFAVILTVLILDTYPIEGGRFRTLMRSMFTTNTMFHAMVPLRMIQNRQKNAAHSIQAKQAKQEPKPNKKYEAEPTGAMELNEQAIQEPRSHQKYKADTKDVLNRKDFQLETGLLVARLEKGKSIDTELFDTLAAASERLYPGNTPTTEHTYLTDEDCNEIIKLMKRVDAWMAANPDLYFGEFKSSSLSLVMRLILPRVLPKVTDYSYWKDLSDDNRWRLIFHLAEWESHIKAFTKVYVIPEEPEIIEPAYKSFEKFLEAIIEDLDCAPKFKSHTHRNYLYAEAVSLPPNLHSDLDCVDFYVQGLSRSEPFDTELEKRVVSFLEKHHSELSDEDLDYFLLNAMAPLRYIYGALLRSDGRKDIKNNPQIGKKLIRALTLFGNIGLKGEKKMYTLQSLLRYMDEIHHTIYWTFHTAITAEELSRIESLMTTFIAGYKLPEHRNQIKFITGQMHLSTNDNYESRNAVENRILRLLIRCLIEVAPQAPAFLTKRSPLAKEWAELQQQTSMLKQTSAKHGLYEESTHRVARLTY